jgi:hypothetical protein
MMPAWPTAADSPKVWSELEAKIGAMLAKVYRVSQPGASAAGGNPDRSNLQQVHDVFESEQALVRLTQLMAIIRHKGALSQIFMGSR